MKKFLSAILIVPLLMLSTAVGVRAAHKANVLVQLLRQKSNLGIFVQGVSNSTVQLSIN